MLSADRITREELYEAVWSEPVQNLARALGISDVGLAKICKKLDVPRPGRGYWTKSRGGRKVLRVPLPPLKPGQDEVHVISQTSIEGATGWTREALRHLAEEGLAVPTASIAAPLNGEHPFVSVYRAQLAEHGLEANALRSKQACLAVSVSPDQLERGLNIVQRIFEACEKQGYQPEVLPPNPHGQDRYGHQQFVPSRTGIRIRGILVAFELKEAFDLVEVPQSQPEPAKGKRRNERAPPPRPVYKKIGSGDLTLEIVEPDRWGGRKRWRDKGARKLESSLDAFLRAALVTADREYEDQRERERRRKEEEAVERRKRQEEARRAELESRMYDLESRIADVHQARAIRDFVNAVRVDAETRGLSMGPSSKLGDWIGWAEGLATEIERSAIQTLAHRRQRPESGPTHGWNQFDRDEDRLRDEVDLWRRRFIFGRR